MLIRCSTKLTFKNNRRWHAGVPINRQHPDLKIRPTEAALGCDEAATADSKSRRRCEKSATASYVGMIRNP
jgi:hypothetical protein